MKLQANASVKITRGVLAMGLVLLVPSSNSITVSYASIVLIITVPRVEHLTVPALCASTQAL